MRTKTLYKIVILIFIGTLLFNCSSKENKEIQAVDSTANNLKPVKLSTADSLAGKKVYEEKCLVCHQPNGIGIEGTFPPLAKSDYLVADKKRALYNVINGFKDSIVVNGLIYKRHLMPEIELTDTQTRDVMNFILNSWGNKGGIVTLEDVKAAQK